ncbi:RhtB family transporter [Alicyclobacillus ferrooxydans]|uniref:RhtB family transporter n=1 Tax=Alicyclobacillus ferrooxydans TaxID=471514 RepID=A0A0P9EFR7_9BACL|nr:RhtB family transporter [Alicyclobacillus ferrooxydans]
MTFHHFGLFLVASFVLLIIPGPSVLYITARSIDQGRAAGLASVFGSALGTVMLVVGSAIGLSAILASSDIAFSIVKYLGAAYLIYLGIKSLFSKEQFEPIAVEPKKLSSIFRQGMFVALLNPKTAIFFFAFLPQFVDPQHGLIWAQTIILGLTLVTLGIFTDSAYALLAGTLGNWMRRRWRYQKKQHYVTSAIYLTLGTLTLFSDSGRG